MMFPNLMVYIAEISSTEVRGSLSNAVNICQCVGLCLTYSLAIFLPWRSPVQHCTDNCPGGRQMVTTFANIKSSIGVLVGSSVEHCTVVVRDQVQDSHGADASSFMP